MMNNQRTGWNLLEGFPTPDKSAKKMENEQKKIGGGE